MTISFGKKAKFHINPQNAFREIIQFYIVWCLIFEHIFAAQTLQNYTCTSMLSFTRLIYFRFASKQTRWRGGEGIPEYRRHHFRWIPQRRVFCQILQRILVERHRATVEGPGLTIILIFFKCCTGKKNTQRKRKFREDSVQSQKWGNARRFSHYTKNCTSFMTMQCIRFLNFLSFCDSVTSILIASNYLWCFICWCEKL